MIEGVNILSSDKISHFKHLKNCLYKKLERAAREIGKKKCKTDCLIFLTFFEMSYSLFSRGSERFTIL